MENPVFPTNPNNVYIPTPGPLHPKSPTIEDVRRLGRVVAVSPDGTVGTVETPFDGALCYSACTLNPDGSIGEFVPRPYTSYQVVQTKTAPGSGPFDVAKFRLDSPPA